MSPAAVLQELEKILSSETFRGAGRSSRLLRFLVEETINGNADRLKDYTLGAEALGRGDDFDPRTDPIARVEASRLRSRLELYYAKEGASDPLQINLPKGTYVPLFMDRPIDTPVTPPSARPGPVIRTALAITIVIAVVEALWLWRSNPTGAPATEMRLELTTPPTTDAVSLALSPDGRKIVYVAAADGRSQLWLRPLDSVSAKPLAGTEYASSPFWSPDSRSIGFFADGKMKRIDIDGGPVQIIARALVAGGATWNRDDVIVFPLVPDSELFKVSAKGGEPVALTRLEPQQAGHRAPQFLPDGRHFLYYVTGGLTVRGVYVGDLDGTPSRRLLDADSPAVYSSSGHVLFVRQGNLLAQKMVDAVRLQIEGSPHVVADQVIAGATSNIAALSASAAGPIAYRTGLSGEKRQFIWFDRTGKEIAKIGDAESFGPSYVSMSPDSRRLALQRAGGGNVDIWLLDVDRGGAVRFTTDPEAEIAPIWSNRGDRVVFSSRKTGKFDLYQQRVSGGEMVKLLLSPDAKQATDWSSDGRFLLFRSADPESDWDIWALPFDEDGKPFPVVKTKFEERDAVFSPDVKWIAYQSNESGRFEIYVQPFPGPGEKLRVSQNGGTHARWRRDGKELFYIALDSRLMAVPFAVSGDTQTALLGKPAPLFFARIGPLQDTSRYYIVSPDGQRFLMHAVVEEQPSPITVVLNWKPPIQ